MPKVDRTAERPTHSKLDQSAVKLLLQNDVAASSAGSVLERFLLVAFLITVFILISVYFKVYDVKQPMVPEADDVVQIRTVYSGKLFGNFCFCILLNIIISFCSFFSIYIMIYGSFTYFPFF